jgi:uncharacterized protein (DUF2384 family)
MGFANVTRTKSAIKRAPRKRAAVSMAVSAPGKRLKSPSQVKTHARAHKSPFDVLVYKSGEGVRIFTEKFSRATTTQMVDVERRGVNGVLLKDLAKELNLPAVSFFKMLGVPKATAEQKASSGEVIAGAGGQAALGMVKLLAIAKEIVESSTSPDAKRFDTAKWLGQWIERPQPSLGGKKPSEFLDTPTGIGVVARLLGAIESGAYL